MHQEQIYLFDTTLRDGQQCPSAGMSIDANILYSELAAEVGVDVLEVGFPAASALDFKIVHSIAEIAATNPHYPMIAALCQLREQQIETTMRALEPAISTKKARLHTYLPLDPLLMQASLGKDASNHQLLIDHTYQYIKKAVSYGLEVEFSAEGYSRLGYHFDFASDIFRAALSAGALVINCPDTVGGSCKRQGQEYFVENMKKHAQLMAKEFPQQQIIWSVHCHNDLGLALDNTMNGIFDGPARQIEGCFNGVGERAGNASLEQCIMYIHQFGRNNPQYQLFTQAKLQYLQKISDFVAEHMLPRQPHWPITGDNAAKHTAGGHTNAIINDPLIYQPFDPKQVGKSISLLFGPMSGSNHAKNIIEEHGQRCEDHEKTAIAQYIKDYYANRRKGISDAELMQAYFSYRQQKPPATQE